MNKLKKEKGITLVALIITIVVLLILAVVSIGAVSDSNIIEYAQKAENDYTIAKEKEQIGLALNEWNIEKVIPGNNQVFKTVIGNALQGQIQPIQGNDDGPLTVIFSKTGNIYEVKIDGTITPITQEIPVEPEPEEPETPEEPEESDAIVYGKAEEYAIINDNKAIYHLDGELPQEYEIVRYEENKGQYTILDSNGVDYEQFIIGKYNGYEVPVAALSNSGKNIHRMNNYNQTLTGFGFTQASLQLNTDNTIAKNIFKEEPKTRIYEIKVETEEEMGVTYYIIRENSTVRKIAVFNGEIVSDEEANVEIKEYNTINLYDRLNIGTFRYVISNKNSSSNVDARVTADGKNLYNIGSNENPTSTPTYNWSEAYTLNENITEAQIDSMYPKATE